MTGDLFRKSICTKFRSLLPGFGVLICSAAACLGILAATAEGASSKIDFGQTMEEPVDIAYAGGQGRLYVANRCSKTISQIESASGYTSERWATLPIRPTSVITDWGTASRPDNGYHVYSTSSSDQLWRIRWPFDQISLFARIAPVPSDIAIDPAGNIYTFSQEDRNVTRIRPNGDRGNMGSVRSLPLGLAVDSIGNMFVSEGNGSIARISPLGVTDLIARLNFSARRIALDQAGNIYAIEEERNRVWKVTQAGVSTIFAETGQRPFDLVFDSAGNLYTANAGSNSVTRITADGKSTINWAPTGSVPVAITVDPEGNVYTANFRSKNVTKISPGRSRSSGDSASSSGRQATVKRSKGSPCGPKLTSVRAVIKPRGLQVVSRVSVPSSGRLNQSVFSSGRKWNKWCAMARTVKAGQAVRLRCNLGRKGRKSLSERSLRLTVRTTLTPRTGPPGSINTRRLEIARQR